MGREEIPGVISMCSTCGVLSADKNNPSVNNE